MATLKEYFDVDLDKSLAVHCPWNLTNSQGGVLPEITARISLDVVGNAKYWSFYISESSDISGYIGYIFSSPNTEKCVLSSEGDTIMLMEGGFAGYSEGISSTTLVFTRRVYLYINAFLGDETRKEIASYGLQKGFFVVVRDKEYAMRKSELEKPLAFISHDSRDKDGLVRELALEMASLHCPVWYDEYTLKVGDSLRENIERGLKETRKCVVVLSPNFLSNEGWGKAEFDSIFTREILEKTNIILPVWHNVTVSDVYQYSPRLADKVGLPSSLGVKELARKLSDVIKRSSDSEENLKT